MEYLWRSPPARACRSARVCGISRMQGNPLLDQIMNKTTDADDQLNSSDLFDWRPSQKAQTLDDARELFIDHLDKGTECPCCGRYTKRYKRKLNCGMAWMIIQIYQKCCRSESMVLHVADCFLAEKKNAVAQEYSKLRFWGLLFPVESDDPKVQREQPGSGFWRLTPEGVAFVTGRTTIPKHVFLVNGKREGFSDERVTIRQCLGNKFDYDELMAPSNF